MSRNLPDPNALLTMNGQAEAFVVKYNVDGSYCMSGHADRSIKLWNANKGTLIKTYTGAHNREIFDIAMYLHVSQAQSMYRYKDNDKFVSCGGDKLFFIWDVLSGNFIRKVYAHTQRINTVALNPLQTVLATGSNDNTVKLWDLMSKNNKAIQILDDFNDSITKIIVTEDQIITGSVDGVLRTYDIRMGKLLRDKIESPINGVDIAEDKKFILVSCLNSTTKLLDNEEGKIVAEYKGHHKSDIYHSSVKFSKDNSYFLQASEDNRVVLYDLATKNELISLRGHSRPVVSIDIHPSEKGRLISGSADGLIKIWGPTGQ